jgi:AraC family transcriptional regulator
MPVPRAGKPPKHFTPPANTSGRGNVLKIGRGVSVYNDLQPPNSWPEHQHATAQIIVALDPVETVMHWGSPGRPRSETSMVRHFVVVPPNTPHAMEWKGTGAMLVLFVATGYIRAEFGHALTVGAVHPLAPLTQQDYLVNRLCKKFHELCHGQRSASELLTVAGATLLAPLLLNWHFARTAVKQSRAPSLSEKRLDRVTDHIQAHLRDPLSRQMLARVAGLTEYHFSRMFKASTGLPPIKYVWRCRLQRARELLETGDWKVAAAAAEVGFCDQSHLVRQFRKEFGCSPGSVIPHK